MIITKRTEVFYRIEMTEAQALVLLDFLLSMQERHIKEVASMAGLDFELVNETIGDFTASLG